MHKVGSSCTVPFNVGKGSLMQKFRPADPSVYLPPFELTLVCVCVCCVCLCIACRVPVPQQAVYPARKT